MVEKISQLRKRVRQKESPFVSMLPKKRFHINKALQELLDVKEGDFVEFNFDTLNGQLYVFKNDSGFRMNKSFIFCSRFLWDIAKWAAPHEKYPVHLPVKDGYVELKEPKDAKD